MNEQLQQSGLTKRFQLLRPSLVVLPSGSCGVALMRNPQTRQAAIGCCSQNTLDHFCSHITQSWSLGWLRSWHWLLEEELRLLFSATLQHRTEAGSSKGWEVGSNQGSAWFYPAGSCRWSSRCFPRVFPLSAAVGMCPGCRTMGCATKGHPQTSTLGDLSSIRLPALMATLLACCGPVLQGEELPSVAVVHIRNWDAIFLLHVFALFI